MMPVEELQQQSACGVHPPSTSDLEDVDDVMEIVSDVVELPGKSEEDPSMVNMAKIVSSLDQLPDAVPDGGQAELYTGSTVKEPTRIFVSAPTILRPPTVDPPESGQAEASENISITQELDTEKPKDSPTQRRKYIYGGILLIVLVVITIGSVCGSGNCSSSSKGIAADIDTESSIWATDPPSTEPQIVDVIFESSQQLYDAFDAYILSTQSTNNYSPPKDPLIRAATLSDIGSWDVSMISDFSYLFSTKRHDLNEASGNQDRLDEIVMINEGIQKFNSDIRVWDVSSATSMEGMFAGAASFNNDLSLWETSNVKTMAFMFQNATVFQNKTRFQTLPSLRNWNLSACTNASYMFDGAVSFIGIGVELWDVRQLESADYMFQNAIEFNEDLSSWKLASATSTIGMFKGAKIFDQNLEGWNMSKVTSMRSMFEGASQFTGTGLDEWETSNAQDLQFMFHGAENFVGFLGDWDTSGVKSTDFMFAGALSFSGSLLRRWNVTGITSMDSMFAGATKFNENLANWKTGSLKNAHAMFAGAEIFNSNLANWDMSGVTDTSYMFQNAEKFNGYITPWTVTRVQNMEGMFQNATSFNADLSGWSTRQVKNMAKMFSGAASFDFDLSGWQVSQVTSMSSMFEKASSFNQNLCPWRNTMSLSEVNVTNMFAESGCPYNENPTDQASAPFCTTC